MPRVYAKMNAAGHVGQNRLLWLSLSMHNVEDHLADTQQSLLVRQQSLFALSSGFTEPHTSPSYTSQQNATHFSIACVQLCIRHSKELCSPTLECAKFGTQE